VRTAGVVLPAALVGGWQLAATLAPRGEGTLASPAAVVAAFAEVLVGGMPPGHRLATHAAYSLVRVLLGFSLALAVGVPLGLAMGGSGRIRVLVRPLVDFLRPISPLAWVPLAIPWFGIGVEAAAFIIFLGAFFPIVVNTCAGVAAIDPLHLDVARTLDASRSDVWRTVLIPGAMPCIVTGARVGLGIAWMTLVAAEFTDVRDGYGLGYLLMAARDLQRTDVVLAGMAAIGLIGLGLEKALRTASARLVAWR
jgi:ABC-type nitrate/sulfonate/bicarbonate transport system permease component